MSLLHEPWNAITEAVIGHAITVHRTLGPGLLESVYIACLAHELRKARMDFDAQFALPVAYDESCWTAATAWISSSPVRSS